MKYYTHSDNFQIHGVSIEQIKCFTRVWSEDVCTRCLATVDIVADAAVIPIERLGYLYIGVAIKGCNSLQEACAAIKYYVIVLMERL